ncbi:50S ribosomal protein L21 [Candidatus Uhrbacteria bacterium]|nr:50S ribosomal protein L21 [Candidatus Uhrbacteria bacterium]
MAQFAVIQTGGKQYLVKAGDMLRVEKLESQAGDSLSFEALLVADEDGKAVKVGAPKVAGASVAAKVVSQGRAKKVSIIKFKNKIRYKRKNGHRQDFTEVKIEAVKA